MLEPDEGKLSSPVLRGEGGSNTADLLDRPRDLEQRRGRSIRQGNQNEEVSIIRYVTEGTFDAYLYQVIESKQKFISQIMTSKSPARTVEDIDEVALSYAEIKALASGNPAIKEKMDLDVQVSKLQLLKQNFLSQKYEMEDQVTRTYPKEIETLEQEMSAYQEDIRRAKEHTPAERETFPTMEVKGTNYTEKQEAGQAILDACKQMNSPEPVQIGRYRGFMMELLYDSFERAFQITLKGKLNHTVTLSTDAHGNLTRLDNAITRLEDKRDQCEQQLTQTKAQLETAKQEAKKDFPQEKELTEKLVRRGELNALLDMDKNDTPILDSGQDDLDTISNDRKKVDRQR